MERTGIGQEIGTALEEVVAHVRGDAALPCRIVDDPAAERVAALRKRLKLSRQKFAERFGLDVRAVQEWEQGRRVPDRSARVLLTVIDHDPGISRAGARRRGHPKHPGSCPLTVLDAARGTTYNGWLQQGRIPSKWRTTSPRSRRIAGT